jgi:hypothetical protein
MAEVPSRAPDGDHAARHGVDEDTAAAVGHSGRDVVRSVNTRTGAMTAARVTATVCAAARLGTLPGNGHHGSDERQNPLNRGPQVNPGAVAVSHCETSLNYAQQASRIGGVDQASETLLLESRAVAECVA